MKTSRALAPLLALSLGACAGPANPYTLDMGFAPRDAAAELSTLDARDEAAPSDAASDIVAPDASDATAADERPACAALSAACDMASNPCCAGLRCVSGVAGFTCIERDDCAAANAECSLGAPDSGCCPGLECMVRGGAGGTVCADPMCRRAMESCDGAHPCCPSSACSGPPGMQLCLPTP